MQVNTGNLDQQQSDEAGTTPAPEGHNEAMEKKFDDALSPTEAEPETAESEEGEKLLGKFKSVEELAKAYQELERKQGGAATTDDEATPEEPATEGPSPDEETQAEAEAPPASPEEEAAEKIVEEAGLDLPSIQDHFYEKGELSDDHYAALEKSNIPREVVDQYLAGVQASADKMKAEVFQVAGGEDNFNAVSTWATENLDAETLGAYNAAADSGNLAQIKMALQGMVSMYEKANGKSPSLVSGKSTNSPSEGYSSPAQMTADMRDPKYALDPAFRETVRRKLAASTF